MTRSPGVKAETEASEPTASRSRRPRAPAGRAAPRTGAARAPRAGRTRTRPPRACAPAPHPDPGDGTSAASTAIRPGWTTTRRIVLTRTPSQKNQGRPGSRAPRAPAASRGSPVYTPVNRGSPARSPKTGRLSSRNASGIVSLPQRRSTQLRGQRVVHLDRFAAFVGAFAVAGPSRRRRPRPG